jgi:invasion protein IalB
LKNRLILIVGGLVAVVAVAAIAYFAGFNGVRNPPQAGGQLRPGMARIVRLPPRKFDSWMLGCIRTPRNVTRCGLILQAVDSAQHRLLLRLTVLHTRSGPIMVAVTPPNAILPQGFTITPEKAKPVTSPFSRCMPRACQAVIKLTDDLVSELNSANTTGIHFVAGSGRPVNFKIPTNGFAAGYAAFQATDQFKVATAQPAAAAKPATTDAPAEDAPAAIDATQPGQTQPNGQN